jgi:hypothetical protein
MDEGIDLLTRELDLNPGAPKELLEKVQSDLKVRLPIQYVDFLLRSNGAEGNVGNSYLMLFPIEEIASINQANAVDEFAPGLLLFGSNGGGTAYAFDTRSSAMPIVEVPFIGMDLKETKPCGQTFVEFLRHLHEQNW